MSLPEFPSGINTKLKAPIPIRRPAPKKPRDPRHTFVIVFIVLMLAIALYPVARAALH